MLPVSSAPPVKPQLPEIKCLPSPTDDEDDDGNPQGGGCGAESDEDIEILLRKTKLLRHSKSAHADLAPPTGKKNKVVTRSLTGYGIQEDESPSDSDEEFYVHACLLPFRKSKSSNVGFRINKSNEEVKSLGTFKASNVFKVIEEQTARITDEVATNHGFLADSIDYWPPQEEVVAEVEAEETRRASMAQRHSRKSVALEGDTGGNGFPLIPFFRTASVESDGMISTRAWSAPAQIDSDDELSDGDEFDAMEHRVRSWSATEKLPMESPLDEISESEENMIKNELIHRPWHGHPSCVDDPEDDVYELQCRRSRCGRSEEQQADYARIDEEMDGSSSCESTTSSSPRPAVLNSDESLLTPVSYLSPSVSASKSDTYLALMRSDRPKTPLCGEPNPSNSSQAIFDPWHSDVNTPLDSPSVARSHSCHNSFYDTALPNLMVSSRSDAVSADTDEEERDLVAAFDHRIQRMQQMGHGAETESLIVQHECFEPDSLGPADAFDRFEDPIPMADDPSVDSPLSAFLVKKLVLHRRSPPIASEDELTDMGDDDMDGFQDDSDVEMSELPLFTDLVNGNETERESPPTPRAVAPVRKSRSDFGWKTSIRTDESVGNLNYWLQQGHPALIYPMPDPPVQQIKRSSTTSAIRRPHYESEEHIYANVSHPPHPVNFRIGNQGPERSLTMAPQRPRSEIGGSPAPFPWSAVRAPPPPAPNHHGIRKSATFADAHSSARNGRRILPVRPDFPPTPEEGSHYANIPCSRSYHEQFTVRPAPDPLCFFPTTSYSIDKQKQHEQLAQIHMQMVQSEYKTSATATAQKSRPSDLPIRKPETPSGPSFTALTLADEIENEKRGIAPEAIDPELAMRLAGATSMSQMSQMDGVSPMSPAGFFQSNKKQRRTLPPLPIEVRHQQIHQFLAMADSPSATTAALYSALSGVGHSSSNNHRQGSQPKEDHTLCYGIDASMMRSASGVYGGMEDSYYEDGINANYPAPRKSNSLYNNQEDSSGVSSCCTAPDTLVPTHRVQSAFIPRHDDEVLLENGDAVHVDRMCEDSWAYGTNLRTGAHGIFPSAHVCEIDLVDELCTSALAGSTSGITASATARPASDRDTFYLTMLASIEVAHHKGNDVLTQSINKVCSMYQDKEEIIVPQTVLMEVSFRGIHIIDKRRKDFFKCPAFDFFYSLQNISFCGAHPKQLRYFGFITKHPLLPRFACHVFLSNESTQPIVESIGRAFKRSYDEYMAFAHPTEDIYIE